MSRKNFKTFAWAAVISIAAGILFFVTAARDIVVGDNPELVTAAATLGVPHPPGYPLFTMIGHLFSRLPFGSIPFRINLLSVVCDALVVGLVFLIAFRLSRSLLAALLAALVLAVNPLFWSWSLVAEVFPLNNLLAALLIYLLVVWHEGPERTGPLMAGSLISGLALTNHQTIILLGPAVCFLLWRHRALLLQRPRVIAICAALFLIGLLPYAYILWAAAHHPSYNWGGVSSLGDLFGLITRQSYGAGHLVPPSYRGGSSLFRSWALFGSFGALLNLLIAMGFAYCYRHRRTFFWFSLLAFIFTGPFFAVITNLDLASAPAAKFVLERFFLLPEVVVAPLTAFGVVMVGELIASYAPVMPVRPRLIVAGGIAAVLAVSVITNFRRIDQSGNSIARTYAEDVFATLPPHAVLLVTGDGLSLPVIYLQTVEQARRDVALVVPPILPANWYVRQLRERWLNIPFEFYDGDQNNLKMLVEANPDRPFAIIGALPDTSLDRDYFPYMYGLVNLVEPKSKQIMLDQMVTDNERLLKRYRPPKSADINSKSFEGEILMLYAQPAWRIGTEYERVNAKAEARHWYQRTLAIDPNFSLASRDLARLE